MKILSNGFEFECNFLAKLSYPEFTSMCSEMLEAANNWMQRRGITRDSDTVKEVPKVEYNAEDIDVGFTHSDIGTTSKLKHKRGRDNDGT